MKKDMHTLWIIIPFFFFLLVFLGASVLLPDYAYSPEEGRSLAQRPAIFSNDLAAAAENWSDYVVDQFPLRSRLLKAYSAVELAQGKKLSRNTYIVGDQWLMTPIYPVDNGQLQRLLNAISEAEMETDAQFVYGVLPQKNDMLADLDVRYVSNAVSDGNKARLLEGLENLATVQVLDVGGWLLETFTPEERIQMYYKGDFHWNHLGAYWAAAYLCDAMSRPADEHDFEWQQLQIPYEGDLNRRFSYLFSQNEKIPYYTYADAEKLRYYDTQDATEPVERETIVGTGLGKSAVDYNGLSTYNLGYYRVENPDRDGCLLILKDSFQNPTIDYFSAVYGEIHVVDPRFYAEEWDFYELVEGNGVDTVLFLFHQNNASAELIDFLSK